METGLTNDHGLARIFVLPREWFKAEADAGRIPCLKIGRRRLFDIDAVRESLRQRAACSRASEESEVAP